VDRASYTLAAALCCAAAKSIAASRRGARSQTLLSPPT
jgi:hypothetical protein